MKIKLLFNVLKNGEFLPEGTIIDVSENDAKNYEEREIGELLTDDEPRIETEVNNSDDELNEIIKNAGAPKTRKKA